MSEQPAEINDEQLEDVAGGAAPGGNVGSIGKGSVGRGKPMGGAGRSDWANQLKG